MIGRPQRFEGDVRLAQFIEPRDDIHAAEIAREGRQRCEAAVGRNADLRTGSGRRGDVTAVQTFRLTAGRKAAQSDPSDCDTFGAAVARARVDGRALVAERSIGRDAGAGHAPESDIVGIGSQRHELRTVPDRKA